MSLPLWHIQIGKVPLWGFSPLVMGILNLTPDSFFDGGRYQQRDLAMERARIMIAQGARIIDLGAESTRPGAELVSVQEEMDRLLPVLEGLLADYGQTSIFFSIDTIKSEVARAALQMGAHLINDISALKYDPLMMDVVADFKASVILNHMQGLPHTMQKAPSYTDVVSEVQGELVNQAQALLKLGLKADQILLDPGIGFGKNLQHNLDLLRHLGALGQAQFPIALGASRKSFIGRIPGMEQSDRLHASVATTLWAAQQGAAIVRVHDVLATVEALTMWKLLHQGDE